MHMRCPIHIIMSMTNSTMWLKYVVIYHEHIYDKSTMFKWNIQCMHAYCHEPSQDTQFKDNQCVYNTGTFVEVISSPWKNDVCGDDICSTAKMSETRVYVPPVYITRQLYRQNIQIMFREFICQQHVPVLTGKVSMLNFT